MRSLPSMNNLQQLRPEQSWVSNENSPSQQEYGFFDNSDYDQMENVDLPSISVYSSLSNEQSRREPKKCTQEYDEEKLTIIFTFNIKSAALSCKSFDSLEKLSGVDQVWMSVSGFRIVQDASGEYAEFKVIICINDHKVTVWRRESDFEALYLATKYSGHIHHSKKYESIWREISRRRFWRSNISVNYLIWKSVKLGEFLREFLFEIPVISVLEAFVTLL